MDILRTRIGEIQRRMRAMAVVRAGIRALFWASCAFLAAIVLDRLVFLGLPLTYAAAACLVAAGAATLAAGARFRFGLVEAALAADLQAGLKERLVSALTVGTPATDMERALVADAQERAANVDAAGAVPFAPPRELRWFPVPAALAVLAALFLPQWDVFARKARADEAAAVAAVAKEQVKKLEKKKDDLLALAQMKKLEDVKKTAQEIEKLTQIMKSEPGEKKEEAMAKLSRLADSIEQQKEKYAGPQETARQVQKALAKQSPEDETKLEKLLKEGKFDEAAQEAQRMQRELGKGDLPAEQREKLKDALDRVGDKLAEQLDKMNPNDPGAKGLQDLAGNLEEAQKALGEKNFKQAAEALKDLAKDLEGLEQGLAEKDAMERVLDTLDELKGEMAEAEEKCEGPSGEG